MFQKYYENIKAEFASQNENSEHTFRTYLQNFLIEFEKEYSRRNLLIKHEPLNVGNYGRPDFKITTNYHLTIGLIETKKIGENLKGLLRSDQIYKYSQLSDNIILTDYLDFYLVRKGEVVKRASIFSEFDLPKKKFKVEKSNIEQINELLLEFFSSEPDTITKVDDLAEKLAQKATYLREFSNINLSEYSYDSINKLYAMYEVFRDSLLPTLETDYFADIYAQTITYGLFLGGLNCNSTKDELNRYTAFSLMPNSFPLIKELFHNLDDFPKEVVWAIDEILAILKVTDYVAIKHEFADYRNREMGFHDPFIYFYEDFLKKYDKTQRELRGVYYTPEAVVSYIVRSIEEVLKDTFDMPDGFVNEKVTVLDFACGTGTFLLNVFKQALESSYRYGDKSLVNKILNERLINRFYGFELMLAPYVVAHLKITEFLKEEGYELWDGKRLSIYLTNTLSNNEPKPFAFMPHLTMEGREANRIKNEDVLVVVGNPPYSVSSQNKTGFISEDKLNLYKTAVKSEKNIQPLSDDYIKFIRFAHWKMEKLDKGVIGIITNNSFLDGLIHRGMREELLKEFDEIYIVNLHGNSRIGEKSADGSKDENIFEIMQGVSISIFVKKDKKKNKKCKVFYKDLFGVKQAKYDYLWAHSIKNTDWTELNPEAGNFFFTIKDYTNFTFYSKFYNLSSIFNKKNMGIASGKDIEFVKLKNNQYEKKYLQDVKPYFYRPFDNRYILYDKKLLQRARFGLMQHILKGNIVLSTGRFLRRKDTNKFMLYEHLICRHSINDMTYAFPLYIYQENGNTDENGNGYLFKDAGKKDNFTKEFRKYLKDKYAEKYTPEQILGYIYAILHSKIYREKYIEFLKIDFPRIPFVDNSETFEKLSVIGWELIQHHLLNIKTKRGIAQLSGEGDNYSVEKVDRIDGKVYINKDRYFDGISDEIWNFYIGGYQVLDKWLKERKKHEITLDTEDILHFINIVDVIDFTINTMVEIDSLVEDWI
jgi:hypothetical protein